MKKKEKTFLETVKIFFEPAFYYKKISLIALVPIIGESTIIIVSVNIIKDITNNLELGFTSEIKYLIWLFIILMILHYCITIFFRHSTHWIMWPQFKKYLYKEYIYAFIYLDNTEAEKHWTWKLVAMIDKWTHDWVSLLSKSFIKILPNILTVIFSIVFVWMINIYYSMIVAVVFILALTFTCFIQRQTKGYRSIRRDNNIGITKKFVKILMSKFEILQNNKEREEIGKVADDLNVNIKLNRKINNLQVFIQLMILLLVDFSKLFVILLFSFGLYTEKIDFWEFLALMSIAYILEQILKSSLNLYVEFNKTFINVEKIWNFFDEKPSMDLQKNGKNFKYSCWKIELKDITFWYNENNNVFENFNLKIPWEKITAMVWASGWWKSTLVKLIAWYIKTDSGEVIIDWQKLNEVSLKSYYKEIWYLTQEPSVFDWTVLENLTYATWKDISDEKIEEIIKLAKCEFIKKLPDGINTQIWERWVRLSWWQKQRLAIAKIFLKDPKIIILDEPTSALDSFSEELITKAMHNLFKDRTVIIIAHRLQTVKHADKIFVIEWGKVVEEWNHKELVKKKGIYKRMLDLQSGF